MRIVALWLCLLAPFAAAADLEIVAEDELLASVDQEAAAYLDQYENVLSQEELSHLQKTHKVIKQKLSELGYFKVMLKRYGKSAAIGALGLELTMDTSLPLMFLWLKMPVAAGAITLVPWSAMGGASGVAWQKYRERRAIKQSLGIKDLAALDNLRKSILQYEGRDAILDVVASHVDDVDELRFSVVKKLKSSEGAAVVSLDELERVIKSEGETGAKFLLYAGDFKSNTALYTAKLIHYISNSENLSLNLLQRFQADLALAPEHLREYAEPFRQAEALRSRFSRESAELLFFQKELKKKLKDATPALKNQIKAYGKETAALLKVAREELTALQYLEYGFLLKINAETGPYPTGTEIMTAVEAFKEKESKFFARLALFRFPLEGDEWSRLLPERAWDLNLVNVISCEDFFRRLIF